jgi:N-acetyl-gamma-glutamyl-phosphate reductase
MSAARIGLVGARGHTGRELIRLISARDDMELIFASSRELGGKMVTDVAPEADPTLHFATLGPDEIASSGVDAVILALPNGASAGFVAAIEAQAPDTLIVDLSADYRFDADWAYGLPEIQGRDHIAASRRIANPGCYATAGQLAIAPMRDELAGAAHVFGVSGYSGAGTTPSRKNDTDALRDNLMPYALAGHIHEREMSRHLDCDVRFSPHVAAFFRGICATVHLGLKTPLTSAEILARYQACYADEALIRVTAEIPELRDGAFQPGALIGGFTLSEDGHHLVVVSVLDNLLKGAAVQAVQNLAIALELPE